MSENTLEYPNVIADTTDMSRDEWLAARRLGIGGSDVAAILGVSPWASRYSLWLDKTEQSPVIKAETPAMRFGNVMEPVVKSVFADACDMEVLDDKHLYAHPEHQFMLANLDGLVCSKNDGKPDAVLEVKTSRFEWDRVPDYYVSQVQHYMAVTNLEMTYVAALFGGEQFKFFEVPRDDNYINSMMDAEAEFWNDVITAQAPKIDGSEATYDAIRKSYQAEQGKTIELQPDVLQLIEQRAAAKVLVSKFEQEVREAESQIMEALKDAEIGTVDGKSVVTWKSQSRSSVDTKALKEAHPDIAEQFTKSSSFRVLRVK